MVEDEKIQIIRSHRRTLSLHVLSDGTVLVKAPLFIFPGQIKRFLQQHAEWIEKRTKALRESPVPTNRKYIAGETFWFLGKALTLTLGNYAAISVKDNLLLFPKVLEFRMKKELINWYIRQAQEIITERVQWYAKHMNFSYTSISFADTKSRWGACTHDNKLQFNWRLVMASLLVINYVVVHELVHTQEKNHSQDFWRKVASQNPSYKQQIKWLKEYGATLHI